MSTKSSVLLTLEDICDKYAVISVDDTNQHITLTSKNDCVSYSSHQNVGALSHMQNSNWYQIPSQWSITLKYFGMYDEVDMTCKTWFEQYFASCSFEDFYLSRNFANKYPKVQQTSKSGTKISFDEEKIIKDLLNNICFNQAEISVDGKSKLITLKSKFTPDVFDTKLPSSLSRMTNEKWNTISKDWNIILDGFAVYHQFDRNCKQWFHNHFATCKFENLSVF